MKFKIFFSLVVGIALLSSCARLTNRIKSDGQLIGSTKASWVVVKQSGGVITDVWKLDEEFVQSEPNSDGWLFVDKRNNPVHVGGDMKAVRLNHDAQDVLNSYIEYHMEFDSLTYQQRYFLEKGR